MEVVIATLADTDGNVLDNKGRTLTQETIGGQRSAIRLTTTVESEQARTKSRRGETTILVAIWNQVGADIVEGNHGIGRTTSQIDEAKTVAIIRAVSIREGSVEEAEGAETDTNRARLSNCDVAVLENTTV